MTGSATCWIGADPGGRNNFGVAILEPDGSTKTWCVSCADEAADALAAHLNSAIGGVGVDAPLWWSSGPSSDRRADRWLRRTYGLSGGEVQTVNSLRGAALAQGMMFVHRIRERYGAVRVTEVHPNALLKALGQTWAEFRGHFGVAADLDDTRKHERDALIAAVAAREGFEGRWSHDLSTDREQAEQDPKQYWLAPVYYFWPS